MVKPPETSLRSCLLKEQPGKTEIIAPPAMRKDRSTHAGLWLDKYLLEVPNKANNKGSEEKATSSPRTQLVREVAELRVPSMYESFYARWKTRLTELGAITREAEVKGRMAVGLGAESVLETSVALHRTYGVPYIPGSALKGLAASYARQEGEATWKQGSEDYTTIFGDTDHAGYITFFDALYILDQIHKEEQALHPDIITVHHANYYQGKTVDKQSGDAQVKQGPVPEKKQPAPADWDSPIPIPFLSATGSYLIALDAPDLQGELKNEWISRTFQILGEALAKRGIGAKTSSGYGRMVLKADPEEQKRAAQRELEEQQRAAQRAFEEQAIKTAIATVEKLASNLNSVAGSITKHGNRWREIKNYAGGVELAQALIRIIKQAKLTGTYNVKLLYQELIDFVDKATK